MCCAMCSTVAKYNVVHAYITACPVIVEVMTVPCDLVRVMAAAAEATAAVSLLAWTGNAYRLIVSYKL